MNSEKLNVGDFGDDVARLHEKLRARGFDVPPQEVKRKFYGPATRDAVRDCQNCHGLEVTGDVNEATAAALSSSATSSPANSVSAEPRLVAESSSMASPPAGRKLLKPIATPLSYGDRSANVANLQDALLLLLEKGRIRLSDDERLIREKELRRDREEQVYGAGTGNVVIAFRQQFQLEPGEIVDERTAEALNRLLQELGAFDAPQAEWVVRGQVVDESGHPFIPSVISTVEPAMVIVRVYDRDIGT